MSAQGAAARRHFDERRSNGHCKLFHEISIQLPVFFLAGKCLFLASLREITITIVHSRL
jgi:hypothetical protein